MPETGTGAPKAQGTVRSITLRDGAALHYAEHGEGSTLLLVHGGGRDLRAWSALIALLGGRWRVIAPSRRYCWPNAGARMLSDYSPALDAEDLAELIERRGATDAVVVGSSMGAAAALHLAVRRPELVRALSLAEPPVHCWAERTVEGTRELRRFMDLVWIPAREAFAHGEHAGAIAIFIDYFLGPGTYARMLPQVRARLLDNARDVEAQTRSSNAFPDPGRDAVARLSIPVQMLSGERTVPLHTIVDRELATLLPAAKRVTISGARHDVWADAGARCTEELGSFLAALPGQPRR